MELIHPLIPKQQLQPTSILSNIIDPGLATSGVHLHQGRNSPFQTLLSPDSRAMYPLGTPGGT